MNGHGILFFIMPMRTLFLATQKWRLPQPNPGTQHIPPQCIRPITKSQEIVANIPTNHRLIALACHGGEEVVFGQHLDTTVQKRARHGIQQHERLLCSSD